MSKYIFIRVNISGTDAGMKELPQPLLLAPAWRINLNLRTRPRNYIISSIWDGYWYRHQWVKVPTLTL